jgi:hypothetical protein
MTHRYALHDEHGRITGYVLREAPHRPTHFRSGARPPDPDSPLVDTIYRLVGLVRPAMTVVVMWARTSAA